MRLRKLSMARVSTAVGTAFAAALLLLVGAPAALAANTLYVDASTGVDSGTCGASDAPCQTISQAISNASPGDTIVVAPGTYAETVSVGTDDLTLEGAQAGNPGSTARATDDPATESVVSGGSFSIGGDNVTVDGFSFDGGGFPQLYAGTNSTIEDNVFSNYQAGANYDYDAAIAGGPYATIVHNYFTSPSVDYFDDGGAVVQFVGGCGGANVSGNTFDNAEGSALSEVYFYCVGDSGDAPVTVSDNRSLGNRSSFAIFLGMGGPVDVESNTVSMVPGNSGTGIIVDGGPNSGAVVVSGNTLTGSPGRALKINPYGGASPGPFTISGNNFAENGVGVYIGSGALVSGAHVTVTGNDLSGEAGDGDPATGVSNGSSETVDATGNWWGCAAGPGQSGCSTVSGSVTSGSWLSSPASLTLSEPVVTGTLEPGQTLSATRGSWVGSKPLSLGYQWVRCDLSGANCVDVGHTGDRSYLVKQADRGHIVEFQVTVTDANGPLANTAVGSEIPGLAPTNVSGPQISGTASPGDALTGSVGTWSGTGPFTVTKQWLRCNDSLGNGCVAVGHTGDNSYLVKNADAGHWLEFQVTYTNDWGSQTASAVTFATG